MPIRLIFAVLLLATPIAASAQAIPSSTTSRIIIDTDIGDDVDDAFAVDLMLASPDVQIVGITSAWGDTALRARMLDRMLCETGRTDIPVHTGVATKAKSPFTQAPWANAGIEHPHTDAVTFLLDQINQHPGEITLLALGPLTNIGAAIDRDPATFRKLKRVVMMGGSIHRGYGQASQPQAEYNIAMDPTAAQKLFRSGVPIYMMPLDSTQIKFDQAKLSQFATISTQMTDTLQILIAEWAPISKQTTPTLFDPVAAAYAINPATCPTTPLHIEVDDKGFTRPTPGAPNANVCLEPREDAFFKLLMPRLMQQTLAGDQACVVPSKK